MDGVIVVGTENHATSDLTPLDNSCNGLTESRSSGLNSADKKNKTDRCEHFSIRGYVAEVRKKDQKICWPFPTVGNCHKLEEQKLPPLRVPEFRWWSCKNCLRKIEAKDAPVETGLLTNCSNTACRTKTATSTGVRFTVSSDDAQMPHSSIQQSPEVNIGSGRKCSTDVSLPASNAEHCPALSENRNEKGAELEHPVTKDIHSPTDAIPEENMNLAVDKSIFSPKKYGSSQEGLKFTNGETLRSDFHIGKIGYNLISNETATDSLSNPHQKRVLESESVEPECCKLVNSSMENFQREKPEFSRINLAKSSGEDKDVLRSPVISEINKEASNVVICQSRKPDSLVSIDNSCESDESLAEEHVQDLYHASQCGNSGDASHGSKPRKLRSLTDIIRRGALAAPDNLQYTEREATTCCMKTEGAQSKATPDAPAGLGVDPVTSNQVAFQGKNNKVMLSKKRKHKLPQDKDEDMARQSGVNEAFKIHKDDSEKDMDNKISNGKPAGDESVLINLHPGNKSFLGKPRNGKKLTQGTEEKQTPHIEDSLFSLAPHNEVIFKEAEVRKDAKNMCMGTEHVSIKSFLNGVAGKDLNLGAQSCVAAEQRAQNPVVDKKRNKVSQVEDEKSSMMPWPGSKNLIIKKYLDRKHTIVPSVGLKSVVVPYTGVGTHHGLVHHMKTHRKSTLNKKKKKLPQVECETKVLGESASSSVFCRPKDTSNACNDEISINVEGPSKLSMDQCNQVANTVSEQAASDDIPMEIVELLARNQYERRLHYAKTAAENRYGFSETTEKVTDSGQTSSTEALENERLRLFHKKSNLPKSQSSKEKDSIHSGPNEGLAKHKSDGFPFSFDGEHGRTHFSASRVELGQASSGFKTFSESQVAQPSLVQFPVVGSRRGWGTENCTWDSDMVGKRCFSTSAQSLGAYSPSQVPMQQGALMGSQSVWSTGPSQMPFASNSSQKLVNGVSNLNKISQTPDQLPKGYMNWEMNEGVHPDYLFACDKGNICYPKAKGPLDLYANETLSAMYLLKLMHAGVHSTSPQNMNDNPERLPKDNPFPHEQVMNELTGPETSVLKSRRSLIDRPSCEYHSETHQLGKSHEHFSPVSIARAVDSPVLKDISVQKSSGFTDGLLTKQFPRSLKHQAREGKKRSYSTAQTRGPKVHMPASIDGSTSEKHEYLIHDPKKRFLCLQASESTKLAEQPQTNGISTKHVQLKFSRNQERILPVERIGGTENCTLNTNPADFTVPQAGNIYMIGAADLKLRKKRPSKQSGGLIDRDGHKRQKKMKLTTINDSYSFRSC